MLVSKTQLEHLEILREAIKTQASRHGFEPALIGAMILRETGAEPDLCSPGKKLGDGGHGHGPMQMDDRWHPLECAAWRKGELSTEGAIALGCGFLRDALRQVCALIPLSDGEQIKAAVAAYNCGATNVKKAHVLGYSLDHYTAHGNYAADVFERAAKLKQEGW